jgi:hypothetical protein
MFFHQLLASQKGRLVDGLPEHFGLWQLGASLLSIGFVALLVDYAYMLYMRSKLVSTSSSVPLVYVPGAPS